MYLALVPLARTALSLARNAFPLGQSATGPALEHHRCANRETIRRARETVRRSAEFEQAWQRAIRAMRAKGLGRDDLAKAAQALGLSSPTDEEWAQLDEQP